MPAAREIERIIDVAAKREADFCAGVGRGAIYRLLRHHRQRPQSVSGIPVLAMQFTLDRLRATAFHKDPEGTFHETEARRVGVVCPEIGPPDGELILAKNI